MCSRAEVVVREVRVVDPAARSGRGPSAPGSTSRKTATPTNETQLQRSHGACRLNIGDVMKGHALGAPQPFIGLGPWMRPAAAASR